MSQALSVIKPENLTVENIPKLREANFLVVGPTDQVAQLNDYFAMRLTHVPVDVSLDTYKNPTGPDLWKVPGGKYAPTKILLIKMASAAGITWDIQQTKRIDNGNDRRVCQYQAVGRMRLPSGEVIDFKASANEDSYTVEEEITEKWLEKVAKGEKINLGTYKDPKWVELTKEMALDKARKEYRQYFKFMHERCMSRAMNRAIRQVLALNGTYEIDQLKRGFVIPQVNFRPNLDDPKVKEMMALAAGGKLRQMFMLESGDQQAQEPVKQLEAPKVDAFTGEVEHTDATLSEADFVQAEVVDEALDAEPMISDKQIQVLGIKCTEFFGSDRAKTIEWLSAFFQRDVKSRKELTAAQAASVLRVMDQAESVDDLWKAVSDEF